MIEHYIRGFEEELREIRHQIHENPELGLQEFKTSALVAEKLRQWGYEVEQGLATTGVVATLKVGDGEKSIGLRADTSLGLSLYFRLFCCSIIHLSQQ